MAKKKKAKNDESIELSPKYGLNHSLDMCIWCGLPRGVVMFGRLRKKDGSDSDVEAPRRVWTGLEPCNECREKFSKGVLVIELTDDGSALDNDERLAFIDQNGEKHWPTGRHCVMNPAVFNGDKKAGDRIFVTSKVMDDIFRMADEAKAKEETAK